MVITHIGGGIGNQLFHYAIGRCLAYKMNTELKLDIPKEKQSERGRHSFYRLGNFNIQENFATDEEIAGINEKNWKVLKNGFIPLTPTDNVFIHGNWMHNELYFTDIEDILRQELTLKNPLGKNSAAWKEKILSAECPVSVHIRLGDYLLPSTRNTSWGMMVPFDYYDNCINELKKFENSIQLFVFSYDLNWVSRNIKFDAPTEFVSGCESDDEELYLMSLCKHNIIVNSTFSWWGAWLNRNLDKKVFLPYAAGWVKQKNLVVVPFDNTKRPLLEFSPMLSIIVYVENNLSTINTTLISLINQNFKDYEIILADASLDGSGKICRRVSSYDKFNVLKIDRHTDKISAWSEGLKIARGDYILFLDGKDFIFPNTLNNLSDIYSKTFNKHTNNRKDFATCDTYLNLSRYTPDIICSTQSIYEDENGTNVIKGIPDKKFSLKVDGMFEKLNQPTEVNLSDTDKLMALATGYINRDLGTKFFKRSFLNENNIRFRKGGGYGLGITFPRRCVYVHGKNYICSASFLRTA